MKASTFTLNTESEAVALIGFFSECGVSASRKGVVVKATGDPALLSYLFGKFVTIALI